MLLLSLKRSCKYIMALAWFDLNTFVYPCSCRSICLAHQLLGVADRQFHRVSPLDSKEKLVNASLPPIAPASQREAGSHTSTMVLGRPPLRQQAHDIVHHHSEIPLCYHVLEVLQLGSITASDLQGIKRYMQVMLAKQK